MNRDQMLSDILEELRSWQGNEGESGGTSAPKPQASYSSGFERAVDPSRRAHKADTLKVSIIGGGNGGMAMAGHMAILGYEITMWSPFSWEVEPIEEKGGVTIVGSEVSGFGKVAKVTRSLDEAVKGADLIMVVAPAMAHKPYASMMAPLLRDGQVVVLNPGRTGGSLEFARTLTRFACSARIVLGETQTFIYAAERKDPFTVEILKEKFRMRASALPAADNDLLMDPLRDLYPQIEPAQNVLETGLNNVAPVVHPGTVLLNTSVLERTAAGEPLKFYQDQVTPTIATLVMGKLDQEKQDVAKALGLKEVWSLLDWYRESYHIVGDSIYEVLKGNPYIAGFTAPSHILAQNHVLDDVPNSLVPIADFGRALGVATPTIDSIVHLASAMCGIDWWDEGRTVSSLGLAGMSIDHMIEHVEHTALGGRCSESGVCRAFGFYG
ncbi:MAG: NAD/NADP octopine/nopaline dehydrogenase family protein [Acidimicrobiia bacterium]